MSTPITWSRSLQRGGASGTAASLATTLVLTACGKRHRDDPAQPVNGPSQWAWGQHAPHVGGFSLKYTVTGYAIHHAMSVFWAVLFERLRPRRASAASIGAAAALTAMIAYNVDFGVVPGRLSPGFQRTLSRRCLFTTYAAFGLALAATAMLRAPRS